jgi:menaquinone-specific isochorismate synthase
MNDSFFPHFLKSGTILSLADQRLLIGHGPRQWAGNLDELDPASPIFYFPDFFLQIPKPWFQHLHWQVIEVQEFQHYLISTSPLPSIQWQDCDPLLFEQIFHQLQKQFEEGKLKKAVAYLFTYSSESMTAQRLQQTLQRAIQQFSHYPEYLYGYWDDKQGILGVTPEILFSYQHKNLQTMALAGTTSKQSNKEEFCHNIKQLEEHTFVIEEMQTCLQLFGKVNLGQTQLLELSTLDHLMTPIRVNLTATADFTALVKNLHPTPALGAIPRPEGWKWMIDYQKKIERGRYGAPVGVLDLNNHFGHCLVAIRNVQWDQKGMRIGVGCGIIKKSQRLHEWTELHLKLQSIKQMLHL